MRFWNRTEGSELEDRLRSERPAPRPEFLRAVASRVDARRVRTSLRLRVAFASGLTLAMFVAVASVGAVSYAASGAQKAAKSFSFVLTSASNGTSTNATNTTGDKTTICHATGSVTNPYVEITISNSALDAHRRHQDREDIIPAPATGCPGGENDDGGDEDDDDADDNQYKKACKDQVKQEHKTEQELHKANMKAAKAAADPKSARRAEQVRHREAQQAIAQRGRKCFGR